MDGFLNIYKEAGMTSHDVVAKIRKILHTKTVGHTGTLDPNAMGVLPVAVGRATKVIEYLEMDDKTYKAELTLGINTDTEDIWGKIIETRDIEAFDLSENRIVETLKSFVGKIQQVPPMYSAIKKDGKKLYELARAGITIEREPRNIEIFDIYDININKEKIAFTVHCSKGTYIRTLCKDIGEKLGCGAAMSGLERTQSGSFAKDTGCTLQQIENDAEKFIINPEYPLMKFPIIYLNSEDAKKYKNGVRIKCQEKNGKYRVYLDSMFYGIGNAESGILKSEKKIMEEQV